MGGWFWTVRQFLLLMRILGFWKPKASRPVVAQRGGATMEDLRRRAQIADENARKALAEAEQQFRQAMKDKIDACSAFVLQGVHFESAGSMPPCKLFDLVMVLPSPNSASDGVELFLGDMGPRFGIIRNSRAAEICREITEDDRRWAGSVFSISEPTKDFGSIVTVMLYRLTPRYWDELMLSAT